MSKILINALSAQLGGGQTHLVNVFSPSHEIWKNDQLIFLVSESNAPAFEREFGKDQIINIGPIGNKFFKRTIWENLYLSKLAIKLNVDFVFLAAGLAPFWMTKKSKWVAISHNLLPYSWKSIYQGNGWGTSFKIIFYSLWTIVELSKFYGSNFYIHSRQKCD